MSEDRVGRPGNNVQCAAEDSIHYVVAAWQSKKAAREKKGGSSSDRRQWSAAGSPAPLFSPALLSTGQPLFTLQRPRSTGPAYDESE